MEMCVNVLTLQEEKYSANSELDKVQVPTLMGFQTGLEMHLVLGRCNISRILAHRPTKLPTDFRERLFSEHKGHLLLL